MINMPDDIVAIYDNDGQTVDRFTIVLNSEWAANPGYNMCLGMSNNPSSPLGYSQFGECMDGLHLGKQIEWEALPEHIQQHAVNRIT